MFQVIARTKFKIKAIVDNNEFPFGILKRGVELQEV